MPKLSVISPEANAAAPVLMAFPSGLPPASVLTNDKETGLRLELRRNTASRRKHQLRLSAESAVMEYTGENFGRDGTEGRAGGSWLVGVHHKPTGTVRLLKAEHLYSMRPSVRNPKVPLAAPGEEGGADGSEGAGATKKEMYDRKRQLVAELGSAKALKKQKAVAARVVSAASVFNAAELREDISAGLAAAGPAVEQTAQEMHPLHPPFDLAATSAAAAYPRSGLVADHLWEALEYKELKGVAKSAEERKRLAGEDPQLWPAYVLDKLAEPLPASKSAQKALFKGVLYLTYMLRFSSLVHPIRMGAPGKGGGKGGGSGVHPDAARLSIPALAWEQLLIDFTEEEAAGPGAPARRRLTQPRREKLTLHALALALHVCGGQLPCAALAKGLGLTEQKAAFFLKQLGCAVEKRGLAEKVQVAVLRVPLTFPKLSRGAASRR